MVMMKNKLMLVLVVLVLVWVWPAAAQAADIELSKLNCTVGRDKYTLDILSGEFTKNGERLGFCQLPYDNNNNIVYQKMLVHKTAGGYLLDCCGIYRGALTSPMQAGIWLSSDGRHSEARMDCWLRPELEPETIIWQIDGKIWLSGSNELVQIDEPTGKVTVYDIGRYLSEALGYACGATCYWQDGRFALLGNGRDFAILDIQAAKCRAVPLLTEKMKEQVSPLLKYSLTETFTEDKYWECFGNVLALNINDPVPYAVFVGEKNGVLHFAVKCTYYDFAQEDVYQTKVFSVNINSLVFME